MKYGKAYNIWEQILDYLSDKLSNAERNTFERELERDPFAAEAQDGFSQLTYEEFINDLKEIDTHINATSAGFPAWKLIVAATVIALAVVFSVLYFRDWSGSTKISDRQKKEESRASESEKDNRQQESFAPFITNEDSIEEAKDSAELIMEETESESIEEEAQKREETSEPLPTRQEESVPPENVPAVQPAPATFNVKGRVMTSDRTPISGARINISGLNKSAVTDTDGNFNLSLPANETHNLTASFTGMGAFSANVSKDTSLTIYLKAIPPVTKKDTVEKAKTTVTEQVPETEISDIADSPARSKLGERAFKSFLKDNAVLDKDSESRRINTYLSVVVSETGTVESVIITESGGEDVDNKAKKMIMEGPGWYPAVRNGIAVKDTIDLKITFRR